MPEVACKAADLADASVEEAEGEEMAEEESEEELPEDDETFSEDSGGPLSEVLLNITFAMAVSK